MSADNQTGETYCGLGRTEAILVHTMIVLEDLVERGVVSGPKILTEEGRAIAMKLKASGFEPTPDETECAMDAIMSQI